MATDVEKLVVQLSADIKGLDRELARAAGLTNKRMREMELRQKKAAGIIKRGWSVIGGAGLAAGVAGALSAREIAQAAAEYVALQNALKVAGLEGKALNDTFATLYQIAQKNGTALGPLVTLYSQLSQSQKELGATSEQLTSFTDGVALALRVAGTDSTSASGALLQLSQAMGGAVVRAEELNSINEGARPILQAVSAGLLEAGGSVSKLRALVVDGKVSSEAFFNAFLVGMPTLQAQADKAAGTVGQATARIQNAFVVLVGKLDETTGASANAANGLTSVASVIEKLPGYIAAAAKGFESLNTWLNSVGNNPFWDKLGKMLGVDYSPEGITRNLGYSPPSAQRRGIGSDRVVGGEAVAVTPVSLADYKVPGAKQANGAKVPRRTADDRFASDIQATRDRTAALAEEQAMIGQGIAVQESRRAALDLEQAALYDLREEARRKGETDLASIQLAPEQIAKIKEVADAYGEQAAALARAEQAYGEMNDLGRDVVGGIISDLRQGTTAAEALANALDKVVDKLVDMALNSLFDTGGGGGLGGLLGSLFGGMATGGSVSGGIGHAASGGPIRGPGTGTSDSIPTMLSNGEFVVRASQARKHMGLLHALNSGRITKMATGGVVGGAPVRSGNSGAPGQLTVVVEGARGNAEIQQMVRAGVSQGLGQYDKRLPGRIQDIQYRGA